MIEKTWLQQDYIGLTRFGMIALIVLIVLNAVFWYKVGVWKETGTLKRLWWRWMWWIEYFR